MSLERSRLCRVRGTSFGRAISLVLSPRNLVWSGDLACVEPEEPRLVGRCRSAFFNRLAAKSACNSGPYKALQEFVKKNRRKLLTWLVIEYIIRT